MHKEVEEKAEKGTEERNNEKRGGREGEGRGPIIFREPFLPKADCFLVTWI
jgi:hypothetical protein